MGNILDKVSPGQRIYGRKYSFYLLLKVRNTFKGEKFQVLRSEMSDGLILTEYRNLSVLSHVNGMTCSELLMYPLPRKKKAGFLWFEANARFLSTAPLFT